MSSEDIARVVRIAEEIKVGMLTTRANGKLLSRPLTAVEVNEDGDLWFFVATKSDLARQIGKDGNVNISFAGKHHWLSICGTAEIVRDVSKKEELWTPAVGAFTSDGAQSPSLALLHVNAESAEYWDNPGGAVSLAASWVKKKLTGRPARPGDSATVDL